MDVRAPVTPDELAEWERAARMLAVMTPEIWLYAGRCRHERTGYPHFTIRMALERLVGRPLDGYWDNESGWLVLHDYIYEKMYGHPRGDG
jgi:hypothetical protein